MSHHAQPFWADSLPIGSNEVTTSKAPAEPRPGKRDVLLNDAPVMRDRTRVGVTTNLVAGPRVCVFEHANASMFSGAAFVRRLNANAARATAG